MVVFLNQRVRVESLVSELQGVGFKAAAIHGEMDQVCVPGLGLQIRVV